MRNYSRKKSMAVLALLISLWTTAMAENTKLTINKTKGNWTLSNPDKTWARQWTSNSKDPVLTLSCPANNMAFTNDGNLKIFTGTVQVNYSTNYTLTVSAGYEIVDYEFTFKAESTQKEMVITPKGKAAVSHKDNATAAMVKVTDIHAASAEFNLKHAKQTAPGFALVKDFTVTIAPKENGIRAQYLYITKPGDKPFRIPALACTRNGKLLAFSDYRPSGSDIGFGEVDIQLRTSTDNGATWSKARTIADGTGIGSGTDCGFGDAAVLADRESDKVLMLCVAGRTPYGKANYLQGKPNQMVRFVSEDAGETWGTYTDITAQVYGLFDKSTHGAIKSMFVGSGKLCQSTTIKTGNYYRVYAPVCARDGGNRVLFTDDFGETWKALGGIDAQPIPGGDEPKCEELPDGRILLSSRAHGGRLFNIFDYTDIEKGEGNWATAAKSEENNKGIIAKNNACNGEILILPVKRNADNKQMFLALQSVPFGPQRTNVGIYYKALESLNDYLTPAQFAKDWTGRKQISNMGSAYSTMLLQKDGKIGFFYEETTYGAEYTNVFQSLPLEYITDNAFTYDPTVPKPNVNDGTIKAKDTEAAKQILKNQGVGYPTATAQSRTHLAEICENPNGFLKADLDKAIQAFYKEGQVEMPQDGKTYSLTIVAKNGNEYYLNYQNGAIKPVARTANAELPASAHFMAKRLENGKTAFATADGKYLTYLTKSPGPNWLKGYNTNCVTTSLDEKVNALSLEKAGTGAKIDQAGVTDETLFGKFYVKSLRGFRTDNNTEVYGYWIVKTLTGEYDGAGEPFLNDKFSSLVRLEKITAPLGKRVTSLNQINPNKVYALYNQNYTAYAVKKEGETNVWVKNMSGDPTHPVSNAAFKEPLDLDSPLGGWQVYKDKDGNWYLYNVGAKQYVRTPDAVGGCTFVNEKMPIQITELGDGLAFNTSGNTQTFFCAAPQLSDKPIATWEANDAGSKWVMIENPNIAPDKDLDMSVREMKKVCKTQHAIYNMAGQKMKTKNVKDLPRGIYIVNGQKMINK